MNKLLKFIIFSAMLVNLGSLLAMDGADHDISQNPFSLDYVEAPFQPIAHESADRWDWLGLNTRESDDLLLVDFDTTNSEVAPTAAPEPDTAADLDISTPDSLLSQLRTSETQSPAPPDSDATPELDTTAPARKTRRRSSSAASASSSSASAASPTDTQDTSKASKLGAPRKKLQPETFVTTQPLPCLWPSEPTCHETFENLENLLEHIKKSHFKESYIHTPRYWPCPYKDCTISAKHGLSRLIYHLFEKHHTPQLQPWRCKNCEKSSSSLESLKKHHARDHYTSSSSSASASSSTDKQASELNTITPARKARRRLQPEVFVTTQPLPCLWPSKTTGSESTCNETFANIEALLEHIKKSHFKKGYDHHLQYWPCPYKDCTTSAQQSLARVIYHLFKHHHTPPLKPWKCLNCGTLSGRIESLQRYHARGRCTSSASSTSASSSTDQQTFELNTTAKEFGISIDPDGVPMFNIAPDDQTPTGSSPSTDSLTMRHEK